MNFSGKTAVLMIDVCVHEHDDFATSVQPLLKNIKAIRDNLHGG